MICTSWSTQQPPNLESTNVLNYLNYSISNSTAYLRYVTIVKYEKYKYLFYYLKTIIDLFKTNLFLEKTN